MFKALARLSFLYNGVHEVGVSRAGRVDGKRATGDAREACLPFASARAARRGACDGAGPGEESSVSFPPKRPTVNRREASE